MLTLLVILILGGIMLFGAFGIVLFFRFFVFGDKVDAKEMVGYKASLPDRFNGSSTVVWELGNHSTAPRKEQLVADAAERGYDLDSISAKGTHAQTLVFKKQAA